MKKDNIFSQNDLDCNLIHKSFRFTYEYIVGNHFQKIGRDLDSSQRKMVDS